MPVRGRYRANVGFARRSAAARETIAVPLDAEPKLVRFDPGAYVSARVTYKLGVDASGAVLRSRSRSRRAHSRRIGVGARGHARGRRRAARCVCRRTVLGRARRSVRRDRRDARPVGARTARQLRWRTPIRKCGGRPPPHSEVFAARTRPRRCIPVAQGDASYFVRAAALESLGKTRDARAFDVLAAALESKTWNATVESGAARGLAELADARALALV